jgi:hypothetical protein
MLEKGCRDCGHKRPVVDFSANRRSRDGLAFYCRDHLAERAARNKALRRTGPVQYRSRPRHISVPAGSKWCPDCGQVKPESEFARSRASASGIASYCLPCHNERGRRSIAKRGSSRTYHLTRRYGITAEEADAILEEQGGVCAICRMAPAQHVDHDHETGAVRALLCFNCNGGLGQFKDDPFLLHVAAFYVQHHRERPALDTVQESANRPGEPPAGSQRRPGRARSTRTTGRTSASSSRTQHEGASGSTHESGVRRSTST